MKLLLDTHVVLWQLGGVRQLGPRAADAISRADELWVSAVSYAEIGVKAAIGKLRAPAQLEQHLERLGVRSLPLTAAHGTAVATLPLHHRDPFDRLLIAQAQLEGMVLISADQHLQRYAVPIVDATT